MKRSKEFLDESERNLLKEWLWADVLLYDQMREHLEEKIENFGRAEMEHSKGILSILNHALRKSCLSGQ